MVRVLSQHFVLWAHDHVYTEKPFALFMLLYVHEVAMMALVSTRTTPHDTNTSVEARHLFQTLSLACMMASCSTVGARAPELKVCQRNFILCSSQHVRNFIFPEHALAWTWLTPFEIYINYVFRKDEMSITHGANMLANPVRTIRVVRIWFEHWCEHCSTQKQWCEHGANTVRGVTVFANTLREWCEHGASMVRTSGFGCTTIADGRRVIDTNRRHSNVPRGRERGNISARTSDKSPKHVCVISRVGLLLPHLGWCRINGELRTRCDPWKHRPSSRAWAAA